MSVKLRRPIRLVVLICFLIALATIFLPRIWTLPPSSVSFSQSAPELEAYDFVEITANVSAPHPGNPFTGASIRGDFSRVGSSKAWKVEGFCDSEDGSTYRVRFMPQTPGDYSYAIEYRQGLWRRTSKGVFRVRSSNRRGPIRIDPQNHWHFIWEGTGEHYYFNGTTAYWLLGFQNENEIRSIIDRFHNLKINRLRVTVAGRTNTFYGEPVMPGRNWTPYLTAWPSSKGVRFLHSIGRIGQRLPLTRGFGVFSALADLGRPDDIYHPGFDYSRFDVAYWRRFEDALRYARDRDMIFSLVLDMNDSRVHPAPGGADERRFIQYVIARFGAFSNITWDLGDDLDGYRNDEWTHTTGTLIKHLDPYQHLATSHPMDNVHQDRTSEWFDFTSFQEWSRNQHAFMLAQRKHQAQLGRIIPQTNEEYGYEDHYPMWVTGPGSDSADTLRRMAWEIAMAGGYQTTGESVRRGTNIWPDTGGGWMNGRGDETMTMLQGYAHIVDFFTAFEWWQTEPHDELVNEGNYCLAEPGKIYVIYLPHGGQATAHVEPGQYELTSLNPVTGEKKSQLIHVSGATWTSPVTANTADWALLLQRKEGVEHSSTATARGLSAQQ